MIVKLLSSTLLFVWVCLQTDETFYRSPALHQVSFTPVSDNFFISDDQGERTGVTAMVDEQGTLYWFRRVQTAVCLTGECRRVDVGLYWDLTGDFFGIDVYGEHLTKTDHSVFSDEDYRRLIEILNDDWSPLREYNFEDLTGPSAESDDLADATSGATRKEIAAEAVPHAVYTTYTLWHLAHHGEKEQLIELTIQQLHRRSLIDLILKSESSKNKLFLLDLFSQSRIQPVEGLKTLIMEGLHQDADKNFQNLALKSLGRLQIDDVDLQKSIAEIYTGASAQLRLRILTTLNGLRKMSSVLYAALERDVDIQNEWFSVKVLDLLRYSPTQSPTVMRIANERLKSNNSHIRASAEAFLTHVKKIEAKRD